MNLQIGVAITPKNFPSNTENDIEEVFEIAKEVGQQAVFIYQSFETFKE